MPLRIIKAAVVNVTSPHSVDTLHSSLKKTVLFDGEYHILGAGGLKAAFVSKAVGCIALIYPNGADDCAFKSERTVQRKNEKGSDNAYKCIGSVGDQKP